MASVVQKVEKAGLSLHGLGVICGLTAGVWLGAAEAPTKLVNAGFSPFAISLCMVAGVFTARWTFPTLLKGTGYVFADLAEKKRALGGGEYADGVRDSGCGAGGGVSDVECELADWAVLGAGAVS